MARSKISKRPLVVASLAAVLVGVGAVAIRSLKLLPAGVGSHPTVAAATKDGSVEFDRFSARLERSDTGERLAVSLRLRTTAAEPMECFVFVVARNDRVTPRQWSIWPPQPPGPAITVGGHFHGSDPTSGHPIVLTDDWARVTATMPETPRAPFDTVVVYVVGADGGLLLSRPFHV